MAAVTSRGAGSSPVVSPGPLHLLTAAACGLLAFALMPNLWPLARMNKLLLPGPCLLYQLLSGPGDQLFSLGIPSFITPASGPGRPPSTHQ